MKRNRPLIVLIGLILILANLSFAQKILIPMDQTQSDHLKAYGIVYWSLKQGVNVEWLLNYRGGSFLLANFLVIVKALRLRAVDYDEVSADQTLHISVTI